ncbi:hypothetical protein ABFX02_10G053900 [Erythranthe guttata]
MELAAGGAQEIDSTTNIQPRAFKPEEEEEDDEDLFEINLEIVNKIPPPQYYYWESYFNLTTSSNALLANCLLPITDISCAVPTVMRAYDAFLPPVTGGEEQPLASFSEALMMSQCYKEMEV